MAQATLVANDSMHGVGRLESSPGRSTTQLVPGDVAPVFTLPDADMEMFDLAQALRSHGAVVLYFFPRVSMPSSLRQAIEFSDQEDDFARLDSVVVGVSLDDCVAQGDFRDEHGLAVCLLSDVDGDACRQYGVWEEREMGGVMRPAVQRRTFIIGRDGFVHHVLDDVGARGHTARVLDYLKELARSQNGNRQEHSRHT